MSETEHKCRDLHQDGDISTSYRSTDTRTDIHAARDNWEGEIRDRLKDDAPTIEAWVKQRFSSVEVWSCANPDLEGIKRVELMICYGGPTVWGEWDGRYGEHGQAHFNHSWGADYRLTGIINHSTPVPCTKVETRGELVEQLLEVMGVLA